METVSRGRELSHAIIARLARRAAVIARELGRKTTLAIVAGSDPASRRFVQIKERLLADVALTIEPVWLEQDATTMQVLQAIAELNARADVDAIFLQFPLPQTIDGQMVADAIVPAKDVDCSGRSAEQQFLEGRTHFVPVAPQAACALLQDGLGSLAGCRLVLAGAEDAFNRALQVLLQRADASVEIVAHDSPALGAAIAAADGLIVGEALPSADAFAEINWLPVILDAGYYLPPRPVGWLPARATGHVGVLLKQYGNVGPLTVAQLARAAVGAAEQRSPQPINS